MPLSTNLSGAGSLAESDVKELEIRLNRLNALYRTHIDAEDRELFPAAARILSAREIEEIGVEMAARRSARAPKKT